MKAQAGNSLLSSYSDPARASAPPTVFPEGSRGANGIWTLAQEAWWDCPISHSCSQVACVQCPGGDPLSGKIQECHPHTTLVMGRLARCEIHL